MATFRQRIPSKKELFLAFASCAFPIYIWAIVNLLNEVPALILRLSAWDLVGVFAYTLSFALIESGLVFVILLVISFVFPPKFFRDKFVVISTVIVFLTSIWFMLAHFFESSIRLWGKLEFALSVLFFLLSLAGSYFAVLRSEKLSKVVEDLVERMSLLLYLYLTATLFFVLIVVIRNFS